MKVLLRRNVSKLGKIGEVVEVKGGYARNYLVPQGLAVRPTEANVKAIEDQKQAYLAELAKEKAQLEAKAELINGKEVTISARANEEGRLYGSVGPAQIASALADEGLFVESEYITLDEPIHQLDKYDVKVNFSEEVSATIHLWILPIREAGDDEAPAAEDEQTDQAEPDAEQEQEQDEDEQVQQ